MDDQVYDPFAKRYADLAEHSAHNRYYERPAMLKILGDVSTKKILDVGCGSGIYAEHLLNAGAAEVVGFDISAAMVELFRERIGEHAKVFQADLAQPLDFVQDGYFDIVLCSLVLHYCADWTPIFVELARKMKEGGRLLFSTGHPFADFQASKTGNYFEIELLQEYWPNLDVYLPNYRRSLTDILDSFKGSGLELVAIVEPRPVEALLEVDAEAYHFLDMRPGFICFELRKP